MFHSKNGSWYILSVLCNFTKLLISDHTVKRRKQRQGKEYGKAVLKLQFTLSNSNQSLPLPEDAFHSLLYQIESDQTLRYNTILIK